MCMNITSKKVIVWRFIGGYCIFESIYETGSVNMGLVEKSVASKQHGGGSGMHDQHFIYRLSSQL